MAEPWRLTVNLEEHCCMCPFFFEFGGGDRCSASGREFNRPPMPPFKEDDDYESDEWKAYDEITGKAPDWCPLRYSRVVVEAREDTDELH